MGGVIRAIGWIVSLVLIALSLYSIISSGEVGYQSWIFLLLIPFSVSLALSSKGGENDPHNISEEWDEDEKADVEKNLQAGDLDSIHLFFNHTRRSVSRLSGAYVCTLNLSLSPFLKALQVCGSPW